MNATLTCPHCGHKQDAQMPETGCQLFYTCSGCEKAVTGKPRADGCGCVYCLYADADCPPEQ